MLRGITRTKGPRTTVPGAGPETRPDLLERDFGAPAPNRVWVADITYCRTFAGWVYAAFVIDVYSRRVVGWQLSKSLRTDLALDALEMGLWTREHAGQDTTGVIAHSDKGVQYLAVRYTQRLAEAGAVASVGSTGDSYDNALAEAFNSLFKAELVRNKGPWKNIDDLEIAVAEYIDWFNHRRLHGQIGLLPPVEFENIYYHHNPAPATADASVQSLHQTRYATLDPQSITVVGGEGSVGASVEWELGGIAPVTRVSGSTRYETTSRLFADYPTGASMAYLASGEHFADALTVSALAAAGGAPVQLSRRFGLMGVTEDALVALDPAAVRLVGGETVLEDFVMQQVQDLLSP
ncbi:IS3 family transposase [Serinicoccus profundi]|uniref:IS3 family transposase n=1 Tax=Serinicoccus profundi TaxID=1078471 RepID=UPI000255EAFA|nr:IS3 family transposase [Serinicoccus profundi]